MAADFDIKFIPSGRGKARCAPDPEFPDGMVLCIAKEGEARCIVKLPYPAPECGGFAAKCRRCEYSIYITAARRRDDPREVTIPCRVKAGLN